jgi:dienelactone hydrolase
MSRLSVVFSILAILVVRAADSHAQDAVKVPDDVSFRKANIQSEGTRMAAEVFAPKASKGKKLPTIVMSHGWGGTAKGLRRDAVVFAQAGYLVVSFDYRGWGASDGRVILTKPAPKDRDGLTFTAEVREIREVVDPIDQTTDLANAIHWVLGEDQCDKNRIALWGSSFSGGHVVYAAARDARIKATVSQVPSLDGRWVVNSRVMARATHKGATDRARGKTGYPKPGAKVIGNLKGAPILERLMGFAPVEDVTRRSDCAMLFVIAENEELFDNADHGILAHARAKGPKKLVTIPGIKHYGVYNEARKQAQKLAIDWFNEHLKK